MVDVVFIPSEYFKFYKNFISYSLTLYYSVYSIQLLHWEYSEGKNPPLEKGYRKPLAE